MMQQEDRLYSDIRKAACERYNQTAQWHIREFYMEENKHSLYFSAAWELSKNKEICF